MVSWKLFSLAVLKILFPPMALFLTSAATHKEFPNHFGRHFSKYCGQLHPMWGDPVPVLPQIPHKKGMSYPIGHISQNFTKC